MRIFSSLRMQKSSVLGKVPDVIGHGIGRRREGDEGCYAREPKSVLIPWTLNSVRTNGTREYA